MERITVTRNNYGWGPSNLDCERDYNNPSTNLILTIDRSKQPVNVTVEKVALIPGANGTEDTNDDCAWACNCNYDIFRKTDKVDRICDWSTSVGDRRNLGGQAMSAGNKGQPGKQAVGSSTLFGDDDETGFSLYDTSKVQKPSYMRRGGRYSNFYRNRGGRYQHSGLGTAGGIGGQSGPQAVLGQLKATKSLKNLERERERQIMKLRKQYGYRFEQKNQQNRARREPSIKIRSNWVVVEEAIFSRLQKLSMPAPTGIDIAFVGSLGFYDVSFDKVSTKTERKLIMGNRVITDVTTTDDPIIREMCRPNGQFSDRYSPASGGDVFMTDSILTTLMCCTKSVYPWDLVVSKVGEKLFFDKRGNFDAITVSETSNDPPNDDDTSINSPKNLSIEATLINSNFLQQVVSGSNTTTGQSSKQPDHYNLPSGGNPFSEDPNSSAAFRYRRFDLGNSMNLVVRCRVDAAIPSTKTIGAEPKSDETKTTKNQQYPVRFINIHALNEWDSRYANGIDWKSKVDTQRGAVLAAELKNNFFKLAKWTASSMLACADQLKFGFVSRVQPKDPMHHTIRGVHTFSPNEFAKQMNLSMENGWAIVRWVVDFLAKQDSGRFSIVKDPSKPTIRIYKIPTDCLDDHDDDVLT